MDKKLTIEYNDGKFVLTYNPSLTIITPSDDFQLMELVANFIDSHEIDKEIHNVL